MYYKDFTVYDNFIRYADASILNVGWLDKDHAFEKGETPEGLLKKLRQILMSEGIFESRHHQKRGTTPCTLCGVDKFPDLFVGTCELWIPSIENDLYFVTPSTVIHYIEYHNYRPPQIFVDSVLQLNLAHAFRASDLYYKTAKKLADL